MRCSWKVGAKRLAVAMGVAGFMAIAPLTAHAQNTCNAFLAIGYTGAQPFAVAGDTVTVDLTLGSGDIAGGTQVTIDRVRFEQDCDVSGPLGLGCTDDGAIISYAGDSTITTTCAGISWTSNLAGGGTLPNQLVFDASPNLVIPENTPSFCTISFDVVVQSLSTDATPTQIEEVAGFSVVNNDAVCDNNLASSGSQSGSITLCPLCDDNNACTTETCNQTTGACDTTNTTVCNDNNACTTEACNTSTGACDTTSTVTCTDNNACTTEVCNTATGACDTTSTTTCNDNNACTTEVCNTTTGACQTTSTTTCNDNNACTSEVCNTSTGACETSSTTTCNDNNACTTEVCNTSTGACETTGTVTCNDNNACTTEVCNATTGACETTNTTTCNDNNACTTEVCNTTTGACDTTNEVVCDDPTCQICDTTTGICEDRDPLPAECAPEICRTPGFWQTHADADPSKACSQNITQAVIDAAGGLQVCGTTITNTDPGNANSALEGMCIKVRGDQELQLVRQLIAASLNCEVSGGLTSCSIEDLIADCNAACVGDPSDRSVTECIGEIDCFNNGGTFDEQLGTCTPGGAGNCHEQALPLDELDLPNNDPGAGSCFGKQGPAGSPDECQQAHASPCTVINDGLSECN
jgi:hypothetical protein